MMSYAIFDKVPARRRLRIKRVPLSRDRLQREWRVKYNCLLYFHEMCHVENQASRDNGDNIKINYVITVKMRRKVSRKKKKKKRTKIAIIVKEATI